MKILEDRILEDGVVKEGNILKVDSFLNHQMDMKLYNQMGEEFFRLFGHLGVTKILTIEASGIGIACIAAQYFDVPVLFAKKTKTKNIDGATYTAEVASYTHGVTYTIMASNKFLNENDRVLIIDDFLAKGAALNGLMSIVEQSGGVVVGCGIAVEKGFQEGGKILRERGVNLQSLAIVESMSEEGITFRA